MPETKIVMRGAAGRYTAAEMEAAEAEADEFVAADARVHTWADIDALIEMKAKLSPLAAALVRSVFGDDFDSI